MNNPRLIVADDFSVAWAKAVIELKENNWNAWNWVVTIKDPCVVNNDAIKEMSGFCLSKGLLSPDKVQHTIFPLAFYKNNRVHNRNEFYRAYNKFYGLTRKMPHSGWGTYFKRMISYTTSEGKKYDQLGHIIDHINKRPTNYGSANFMVIPQIGKDSNRIMGSPCLNYVTVQVEKDKKNKIINLLAVYRNHDFRERTFGNYWGLCELLKYICTETYSAVGRVTCVSSHAFIKNDKNDLYLIAKHILGE